MKLVRRLPIHVWASRYDRATLSHDLIAAAIVTIMLVPQSLAYAMIAGMPAVTGLYASMLPLIAYAIFGTSRTLAVGPVALISLMTASAVGEVTAAGIADHLTAAAVLALMSGGMLIAMGALRLGALTNFLSHPVISGFVTGSSLLIAAGQVRHLLGIQAGGETLPQILTSLWAGRWSVNAYSVATGIGALLFLWIARRHLANWLRRMGMAARHATTLARCAPILAVIATAALAAMLDFASKGVPLVGAIPAGLPSLSIPHPSFQLISALAVPALLISVIGFVESASMAQTLAARRRETIDANQELLGLGAANIAAGLSQAFPVTGGFARSVVNDDAGAQTPAAGIFTAVGIALASLTLTPLLAYLPQATLAATIILAVLSLIDLAAIRRVFSYSPLDFCSLAVTLAATLLIGVEVAIIAGVALSLLLYVWRTSRPHIAVLGQVPGTEHFRNILRHDVLTDPRILSIRIDASLYFANARFLEQNIARQTAGAAQLRHVILLCTAINDIDASGLDSLERISERLKEAGICFHLSEVKGPVMDKLMRSDFPERLNGRVFFRHCEAVDTLSGLRLRSEN